MTLSRALYFDRQGQPITFEAFCEIIQSGNVQVAKDTVGEAELSTVHIPIDRSGGVGEPIIFESMIFGGERDGTQVRYSTEAEALAGHAEILEQLRQA